MTDKSRVLVVDDDVEIQRFLNIRLKKLYAVTGATCQEEAFAALETGEFDVVLLDLKLPRTSSDLDPSPDVGVDILRQIRERKIYRRASKSLLPVIVITAFGGQKLFSAEFLGQRGACDYLQKPFGSGDALNKKLELALCGEGAFTVQSQPSNKVVQLRFDPGERRVLIEEIEFTGASYDLLVALRDRFLVDHGALVRHDRYGGLTGFELAHQWSIEDHAVRQRVAKFRKQVAADFLSRLGRSLADDDIIENLRTRDGYRLNPLVVKVVAWEQEMGAPPRR
ncbi:MAG: response regulator [Archangium sp.]|nr:response regulator [Archangium sp.]